MNEQKQSYPVVIIGAGPVGLAAAAHLVRKGELPVLLEGGATVGASMAQWGHVRLFSPWRYVINQQARAFLVEQGWQTPDLEAYPTGREIVEQYLLPLSRVPAIKHALRLQMRVKAVSRMRMDKVKTPAREETPFVILTLIGGLASPIFIPLSGWLVPQIGWRIMLFCYGLLHLVIAVPLHWWLVRRPPEQPREASTHLNAPIPEASITTSEALVSFRFWVLTGAYGLALVGSAVVFAHQIAYLVSRGYGALLAATVAGALGLASLPGRFFLNLLSARVLPQTVLAGTLLVQATGIMMLILVPSAPWLLVYVLLYGAAFGVLSPLRAQVMADHFGKRAYGAITGVQGIPLALCQAAGPLVAGWLFDRLHHYDLAFWLCMGGFVLAALLILSLPHPAQKQAGT